MRLSKNNEHGYYLTFNENDTYKWANRYGAKWPCSYLQGKAGFVVVDENGLCDVSDSIALSPVDELNAFVYDMLYSRDYKHYKQARKYWPTWED